MKRLTRREHEVFLLVTDGYTNKEMANMLDVTDKTIEAHRSKVMRKTGANGLADLIKLRRFTFSERA
ncbi:MAG: helix-turn-helix transcriptional regulator [Emcibacter sp.]|nr:helix-turn-helix transcriptional regulator [Emcibacter sp.]